jgi:hypothetical protein
MVEQVEQVALLVLGIQFSLQVVAPCRRQSSYLPSFLNYEMGPVYYVRLVASNSFHIMRLGV